MNLKWHPVPVEFILAWNNIFICNEEGINLSYQCPVCSEKTLHRYFDSINKVNNVERRVLGGEWQWCSSCKSYEHSRAFIPKWWSDNILNDNSILTPIPNTLDIALKDPYKINKWIRLSKDYYIIWNDLFSKSEIDLKINNKCPNCNSDSLYQYYYCDNVSVKHKKRIWKGKGANWQWCSSCFSYVYNYDAFIPYEWSCPIEVEHLVEESEFMTIPENINEIYKFFNL